MNPVLKKLLFKGQAPVLVHAAPPEFAPVAKAFGVSVDHAPKVEYAFALAFVRSLQDAEQMVKRVGPTLSQDALFWMAYPKGTSKRYPKVDIHRDTGNAALQKHGFEGVAMVAIDDDWSAMRFKRKAK